ncbi:MAG TPA: prolyl oligopeptidase family serine peptidase [Planctomycetota bacterium]|nr:prolyl oligopeptidase family serine peptidase [Planctomycetota bacterium]HRR78900.1 prolyl oligopeptidase family serine peptidase [Planctomycetota bacterium]HRT92822.1 prolyl oligopeptidase family serine peptidase [Planctomycetota bacterium]
MTTALEAKAFAAAVTKRVACRYLLYLPKGYERGRRRWPLLLFLHGAGERGRDLELVKKHGPPRRLAEGHDLPFIVVSPQCPGGRWWSDDVLAALLDDVIAHHRVDERRVYLTGLSMGGYGAWSLACEHPERFAAIAPVCGGGNRLLAHKLKDVPVWAFHGAHDDVVPLAESEKMVKAVQAAGGKAKLTVYPHAGHDAWTATYANPDLYTWLLRHRKRLVRPQKAATCPRASSS